MTDFPSIVHLPSLRRYAPGLTGDKWAADDLVQGRLERPVPNGRLWTVGSDLRAWLFTLAGEPGRYFLMRKLQKLPAYRLEPLCPAFSC